ncbi:hypothetical protein PINS_up000417 [Pythium insidiosum]|nr:hypothetical protein PINS_up000417 [Pythium insidiosum]
MLRLTRGASGVQRGDSSGLRRRRSMPVLANQAAPSTHPARLSPNGVLAQAASPRKRVSHAHTIPRDDLLCPICFDMLCYPVTLPCGHNFDRGCLLTAWEHESNATAPAVSPAPEGVHDDDDPPPDSVRDSHSSTVSHLCPLCRQRIHMVDVESEIHVNLMLQQLITHSYPGDVRLAAESGDKQSRSRAATRPPTPPKVSRRLGALYAYVAHCNVLLLRLAGVRDRAARLRAGRAASAQSAGDHRHAAPDALFDDRHDASDAV